MQSDSADGVVVGTVAHLDVTAVKGFTVVETDRITVTATGVIGNREFFFVEPTGRIYSVDVDSRLLPYWSHFDPSESRLSIGKDSHRLFDEPIPAEGDVAEFTFETEPRAGYFVPGPWDAWASSVSGRTLALVRSAEPGGAYDTYPLTLQTQASLDALGAEADGTRMDRRRFRMQLTLAGVASAFIEDDWAQRTATIGSCRIRIGGPVPRCVGAEHNPADLSRATKVLQTINRVRGPGFGEFGRGLMFGVYASVLEPGVIRVGDTIALQPR